MKNKFVIFLLLVGCVVAAGISNVVGEVDWLAGLPLVVAGTVAVIFSRPIAEVIGELNKRLLTTAIPFYVVIPGGSDLRPYTVLLLGIGLVILGLAWMFA